MTNRALTEGEIAELVARHPLPAGMADAILNREQLAAAMMTSLNTVTAWITDGMPVQAEGRNGKPYELKLSHCFAWNKARRLHEEMLAAAAQTAIGQMRMDLLGGSINNDSIEALDPRQRRDIYMEQRAYEELEKQRNNLIPRSEVEELLDVVLAGIRDGLEAAADLVERADPTISAKHVGVFLDVSDAMMVRAKKSLEQFLLDRPLREVRAPRADLFDA